MTGTGYCSGLGFLCSLTTTYPQPSSSMVGPNIKGEITTWEVYGQMANVTTGAGLPVDPQDGCGGYTQTVSGPFAFSVSCGTCGSSGCSPIVIDVDGAGFHLTNAADGVLFRDVPSASEVQMSWTDPAYRNGWLALPKNGKVEALSELFGDFTPQPPSEHPNGFAALAVYDLNHDGVIDSQDAIYSRLRVWIDANHDGIAQPEELHTLAKLGVQRISLHYRESPRVDQFGNRFRYVAAIEDAVGPRDSRCYDVFLVSSPH